MRDKARQLRQQGLSYVKIAKACGVSKITAMRWTNDAFLRWHRLYHRLKVGRKHALKGNYKPCTATVEELLSKFRTRCEICRRETDDICLDHDHTSGKFRGWLCHTCNNGLGQFQDSKTLLRAAISYLGASKTPRG